MPIFEWALAGAVILAGLVFSFRLMRRGISSLDADRHEYMDRIRSGHRRLEEDAKNISSREHLAVLEAGLRDLIRLEGLEAGCRLQELAGGFSLAWGGQSLEVRISMRERRLSGSGRTLHGPCRWILLARGEERGVDDLAELMRLIRLQLAESEPVAREPAHFARRFAGGAQANRALRRRRPGA